MCVASKHWELTVGRETSPREHRPHLGTELAPQIPAHFLTLRSHAKSLPSRELPSSFDLLPEIWQTEACLCRPPWPHAVVSIFGTSQDRM